MPQKDLVRLAGLEIPKMQMQQVEILDIIHVWPPQILGVYNQNH